MHRVMDRAIAGMTKVGIRNFRYFSESIETASFEEHLDHIHIQLPIIQTTLIYEFKVDTLVGKLDPAIKVVQWLGHEYPTIVFHHGNNEQPFAFSKLSRNSFKSIFLINLKKWKVNLILVRAPYHKRIVDYVENMKHLSRFMAMMSVSVKITEAIREQLSLVNSDVIVCGISLGGWVTNIHKAYYDSAAMYIPVMAGGALGSVFTSSSYSYLVSKKVREQERYINQKLNFEKKLLDTDHRNLFPLLAYCDQYVQYERQKLSYRRGINVVYKGHITATLSYKLVRHHIDSIIKSKYKKKGRGHI